MNKITQFEALIWIRQDLFSNDPERRAALRGLRRIYEARDTHPRDCQIEDPVAALRPIAESRGMTEHDKAELRALRKLAGASLPSQALAERMAEGHATLAHAIAALEITPESEERERTISSVRAFCRGLVMEPEAVMAREREIEARLAKFGGADFNLSRRSWQNFQTRIRRAVRLVDCRSTRVLRLEGLTGEWRRIVEAARHSGSSARGDLAKIWGLMRFCFERGMEPSNLTDETVTAYLAAITADDAKGAFEIAAHAVLAWQRLQKRVPGWPSTTIARLYRGPKRGLGLLAFEDLPAQIRGLWNSYAAALARKERPASLTELVCFESAIEQISKGGWNGEVGHLSQASLANHRHVFRQAVAIAGLHVRAMADLATPEIAQKLMLQIDQRQKKAAAAAGKAHSIKSYYKVGAMTALIGFARFGGAREETIETLIDLRDFIDPRQVDMPRRDPRTRDRKRTYAAQFMGARHRQRLRQFENPAHVWSWYVLPERLEDMIRERLGRRSLDLELYNLSMVEIMHHILRSGPIRRKNLAELRISGLNQNLFLPPLGKGRLNLSASEVKNNQELTIELDERAVERIRFYIDQIRSRIIRERGLDPASPWLFPAATGTGHRGLTHLNGTFVRVNKKLAGIDLNLHLVRHLAAKLVLDQDPTKIETVRILLGHKRPDTTIRYYAEINQILAQRKFQEILLEAARQHRGQARRRAA